MASPGKGWTTVAFGDVVRKVSDRVDPETSGLERYVAGEHMDTDDLRIRRWGLIGDGYLGPAFHMRFKPGQVLYGSRRTYLRKVAVPGFEGVTANTTFVLEPKDPAVLLPEFLPYVMSTESFHRYSIEQSKGSVNPYINFSDLASYGFALPPLVEQTEIAKALDGVDAVREGFYRAQGAGDSVIQSLVSHRVLGSWMRRFGDVIQSTDYGSSARATSDNHGLPILRIPNVLRGKLDLSDLKWVELSREEVERNVLVPGDILVVRTNGNPDYVGRCVVVPELDEPTLFASYLIRVRVDRSQILPEFAAAVVNSSPVRRSLGRFIRSSAGNFNLNSKGIRGVEIPCPPMDVQNDLLGQIRLLGDAAERMAKHTQELGRMRRAILGRLAA